MTKMGWKFAADSNHAIQPLLIGDPVKTRQLVDELFNLGYIVTNISYPVVPKGKDEIRIQISASHSEKDLDEFMEALNKTGKLLDLL